METIFIMLVFIVIGHLIDRGQKRLKKYKKKPPNKVFKPDKISYPRHSREADIQYFINIERAYAKLKPLQAVKTKGNLAMRRANEIDRNNKLSHTGVVDEFNELRLAGSDSQGEILTYSHTNGEESVKAWMKSEGHKKAILNRKYDYCDIACKKDERKRWIDVVLLINEDTIL